MPEDFPVKVDVEGLPMIAELVAHVAHLTVAADKLLAREELIDNEAWPEVNELRASLNLLKRWAGFDER